MSGMGIPITLRLKEIKKRRALRGKQRVELVINSVGTRTVVLLNPSFFYFFNPFFVMRNNLAALLTRTVLILFGFFGIANAQATDDSFVNFKFDSTKHESRLIKAEMKNFSVVVTIVKDKQIKESNVWFKETLNSGKSKEKYLGQTNSEFGFYAPTTQPLENCYLFAVCSENNCNFIYLNEDGDWFEFPGYYFAISKDRKFIYTTSEADGEIMVSKFDLVNNKVVTKKRINEPNRETWNGIASKDYYRPSSTDWLR